MKKSNIKILFISILKTARPAQWIKNVFVLAPIVFSFNLNNVNSIYNSLVAFFAFSLASSSVYFLNDIRDISKDKIHPRKRFRPIASGELSIRHAGISSLFLAFSSLLLTFFLNPGNSVIILSYITINILYSLKLKEFPYLDVMIIAFGFILRISMGAFAIKVDLSIWIIINTALLSIFLGFGKRYHELKVSGPKAYLQRPVLKNYNKFVIKYSLWFLLSTIPIAFFIYSLDAGKFNSAFYSIGYTTPLIFLAQLRFYFLCINKKNPMSPTELMLRDPLFILTITIWSISIITLLYYFSI